MSTKNLDASLSTQLFLTERKFAARLSVGASTIRRWRTSGRLPHFKLGGVIRYRLADVENFEADHLQDAFVLGFKRPNPIRGTR
jgi:excisionase family DNA binding protein